MQILRTAALVIALGFVVSACSMSGQPAPTSTPETMMEENSEETSDEMMEETSSATGEAMMTTTYTLAQVAQHATKDDCWMAMEGGVYDITAVIASGKHPGGVAIIAGCGKDATTMFNNRPNGSGAHSEQARAGLMGTKIGVLAE